MDSFQSQSNAAMQPVAHWARITGQEACMNPLVWNDLPTIDQAAGLDDANERCLEDIRAVIKKHGKTHRFGAFLLHQHFLLSEDELLVEHCDAERRTLTTAPMIATEVFRRDYTPTMWRFDGEKSSGCSYCPTDPNGKHFGYKEPC